MIIQSSLIRLEATRTLGNVCNFVQGNKGIHLSEYENLRLEANDVCSLHWPARSSDVNIIETIRDSWRVTCTQTNDKFPNVRSCQMAFTPPGLD